MNEKIAILKMLEEGKINADEAARLLEAGGGAAPKTQSAPARQTNRNVSPAPQGEKSAPYAGAGTNSGGFSAEAKSKFDNFAASIEPKLQKFTQGAAAAADVLTEKISKTLAAPPAFAERPAQGRAAGVSEAGQTEKTYAKRVAPGYNELNLNSINGDVVLQGYNGDTLSANITCVPKKNGTAADITDMGGKFFLNPDEDDFKKVSVNAVAPAEAFSAITLGAVNGRIDASNLKAAGALSAVNLNGTSVLRAAAAGSLFIDCNGAVVLENVSADMAKIEAVNGGVTAAGLSVKEMTLSAINGAVSVTNPNFASYGAYMWTVESSNAKLKLSLPAGPGYGYHIKAKATFSEIKISLTGLSYIVKNNSYAEAKSEGYDEAPVKIHLALETSNAPLVIN